MEKGRGAAIVGISAAALLAAKFGAKVVAYFAGFFIASSTLGFFSSSTEEKEMRAGFEEISSDWSGWVNAWKDSTSAQFRSWGARIAAEHVTETELLQLYQFRTELFPAIADDPSLNQLCGGTGQVEKAPDFSALGMTPVYRIIGRGFARRHGGAGPWIPVVNLAEDENAWAHFGDFLRTHNGELVLQWIIDTSEGRAVPAPEVCRALGQLYGLAVAAPNDQVGNIRLLEFVRSFDHLGVSATADQPPEI